MNAEVEPLAAGPAPAAEHHPTTVGNYFVSNYPPFSFWRPDAVGDFFDALRRPPQPETPLGIYLHIPFCRKRCHFCYFRVYTDKNSAAIKGYIDAALEELTVYAAQPLIGGRKPKFRLFRRRHAELSLGEPAAATHRPDEGAAAVGRSRGSHLRMRAGHAHGSQAQGDSRDRASRASASASRISTTTSWRSMGARIAPRKSGAPTTTRANSASRRSTSISSPAWSRRPRTTGASASQDHRALAGQRDDLPDGSALQHEHLQRDEGRGQARRAGRGLGAPSATGWMTRSRSWKKSATRSRAPTPR